MAPHRKKRKLSDGSPQAVNETVSVAVEPATTTTKEQRRSLFVRSLPASVTTERLAEHFSEAFPLKHAVVVVDPKTEISKGFGFVTFTDAEDAQAAADRFNNSTLDGRKIKVEVAEARHRDLEEGVKKAVNTTAERLRGQRDAQRQDTQPPRLIIRNLPWSIKEADDLAKLFLSYGKVKHAIIPKKNPKTQYGFGIVILRGKKNAEKALAGLNGKEVDGRVLAVDWAVDKDTWKQAQKDEQDKEVEEDVPAGNQNGEATDESIEGEADAAAEVSSEPDHSKSEVSEQEGVVLDSESDNDIDNPYENDSAESEDDEEAKQSQDNTTVFIRNLPYEADDDTLKDHFRLFGPVRYARVVYDPDTERSRGTGFVCFFNESDAKTCVRDAPKKDPIDTGKEDGFKKGDLKSHTLLQNEAEDPSGQYTLQGRVLQVSRALSKPDADRRANEASDKRLKRDGDKRRLYLLSEGTIPKSSPLHQTLGKAELDIRSSSARQRQKLIKSNPNLCLSLTRLSIRNMPRHLSSKDLKALARDAVVGFSKDVKSGVRNPLSRDELKRGSDEMREAEKHRKEKGVGIVKQAKVVFEGREGGKIQEGAAGRSRGYGFVEYYTHRNALAGLRWLNGHAVKAKDGGGNSGGGGGEKTKRLIVEFAIENAQVVQRRNEREKKMVNERAKQQQQQQQSATTTASTSDGNSKKGKKRKRSAPSAGATATTTGQGVPSQGSKDKKKKSQDTDAAEEEKNRLAKRNRIIAKKRHARKTRKG